VLPLSVSSFFIATFHEIKLTPNFVRNLDLWEKQNFVRLAIVERVAAAARDAAQAVAIK